MAYKINPFSKKLDFYSAVEQVASTPTSGFEGQLITDTSTNEMKIYYGGTWQTLHTLTPGVATGIGTWIIGTDFVVS